MNSKNYEAKWIQARFVFANLLAVNLVFHILGEVGAERKMSI